MQGKLNGGHRWVPLQFLNVAHAAVKLQKKLLRQASCIKCALPMMHKFVSLETSAIDYKCKFSAPDMWMSISICHKIHRDVETHCWLPAQDWTIASSEQVHKRI